MPRFFAAPRQLAAPPDQPNGVFIDVVPMMHCRSARWKRLDDVCTRLLAVSRMPRSTVRWKRVVKGAVFYCCCTPATWTKCFGIPPIYNRGDK